MDQKAEKRVARCEENAECTREQLIRYLKMWSAEGFRLRPDATHIYLVGSPALSDMKKTEGDRLAYWSEGDSAWISQRSNENSRRWYTPLSMLSDGELEEFRAPARKNGMYEDPTPALITPEGNKEKLIRHLRVWSAKGFKLHPEATHMYPEGEPMLSDMKRIVDEQARCWSEWDDDWYAQRCAVTLQHYLPLSMLTDDELAEFTETPAQEKHMRDNKEKLLTHLKFWAAKGYTLHPEATHMFTRDKPIFGDMKKFEGDAISWWSQQFNIWVKQPSFNSAPSKHYLPLSLLSESELSEFREDVQEKVVHEDKEKLIHHLKRWSAKGYKLHPEATHMYTRGAHVLTDTKKIEGKSVSYWSPRFNMWVEQPSLDSGVLKYYLPLSMLSAEELAEFREPTQEKKIVHEAKEKLLTHLRKWSACGFKLRRDATHMYTCGAPIQADMRKDGQKFHWNWKLKKWVDSVVNSPGDFLLPLSLLSESELSEFYEDKPPCDNEAMLAADGTAELGKHVEEVKPAALAVFPATAYNTDTTQPHNLGGFFG